MMGTCGAEAGGGAPGRATTAAGCRPTSGWGSGLGGAGSRAAISTRAATGRSGSWYAGRKSSIGGTCTTASAKPSNCGATARTTDGRGISRGEGTGTCRRSGAGRGGIFGADDAGTESTGADVSFPIRRKIAVSAVGGRNSGSSKTGFGGGAATANERKSGDQYHNRTTCRCQERFIAFGPFGRRLT